jgi:hypothetical protein
MNRLQDQGKITPDEAAPGKQKKRLLANPDNRPDPWKQVA